MQNLIDRRIEIKMQIDQLTEELKGIDEEIWNECEPGEVLLGSDGYGYKLTQTEVLNYGQIAISLLKQKGLIDSFVKISTTGIEKLAKDKKLSWAEVDILKSKATVKTQNRIVQFIPDEVKKAACTA